MSGSVMDELRQGLVRARRPSVLGRNRGEGGVPRREGRPSCLEVSWTSFGKAWSEPVGRVFWAGTEVRGRLPVYRPYMPPAL